MTMRALCRQCRRRKAREEASGLSGDAFGGIDRYRAGTIRPATGIASQLPQAAATAARRCLPAARALWEARPDLCLERSERSGIVSMQPAVSGRAGPLDLAARLPLRASSPIGGARRAPPAPAQGPPALENPVCCRVQAELSHMPPTHNDGRLLLLSLPSSLCPSASSQNATKRPSPLSVGRGRVAYPRQLLVAGPAGR